MATVAWVTCREIPEPDPDEGPGIDALRAAGLGVEKLAWDDPGAPDPGGFDLLVLRSCWNYYRAPEAFLGWIERAAARTRLRNPLGVVRWNLHKGYLRRLRAGGLPIVPTEWLERGTAVDLGELLRRNGWERFVVKPSVSAASFSTRWFDLGDVPAARAFLDRMLGERDMLVQELVPSVAQEGERASTWIDGELTHAVVKRPRLAGDDESVSAAVEVLGEDARLAEGALAVACEAGRFAREELLYARLDTVELRGERVISELELLEPSLFLLQHPAAMERFVRAVARAVAPGGRPGAPQPGPVGRA